MSKIQLAVIVFILGYSSPDSEILLPVNCNNRKSLESLRLTQIGEFGVMRKARPGIPAHYHTGIDIMRPNLNYEDEPIYPISKGKVISKRNDGPYAQLIIEHFSESMTYWSVYEHIAGIRVSVDADVLPTEPIARFMNKSELERYGKQFDHFHFEVLKVQPLRIKPTEKTPDRHFSSFSLSCTSKEKLDRRFWNPLEFLGKNL